MDTFTKTFQDFQESVATQNLLDLHQLQKKQMNSKYPQILSE